MRRWMIAQQTTPQSERRSNSQAPNIRCDDNSTPAYMTRDGWNLGHERMRSVRLIVVD